MAAARGSSGPRAARTRPVDLERPPTGRNQLEGCRSPLDRVDLRGSSKLIGRRSAWLGGLPCVSHRAAAQRAWQRCCAPGRARRRRSSPGPSSRGRELLDQLPVIAELAPVPSANSSNRSGTWSNHRRSSSLGAARAPTRQAARARARHRATTRDRPAPGSRRQARQDPDSLDAHVERHGRSLSSSSRSRRGRPVLSKHGGTPIRSTAPLLSSASASSQRSSSSGWAVRR